MRVQDNFEITKLIDLTTYENENKFLEGTGSIVFDYSGKTVHYIFLLPRLYHTSYIFILQERLPTPVSLSEPMLKYWRICASRLVMSPFF